MCEIFGLVYVVSCSFRMKYLPLLTYNSTSTLPAIKFKKNVQAQVNIFYRTKSRLHASKPTPDAIQIQNDSSYEWRIRPRGFFR